MTQVANHKQRIVGDAERAVNDVSKQLEEAKDRREELRIRIDAIEGALHREAMFRNDRTPSWIVQVLDQYGKDLELAENQIEVLKQVKSEKEALLHIFQTHIRG